MTAAPAMPLPLWNEMSNFQMPPAPDFDTLEADLDMAFGSGADLQWQEPSPFDMPQGSPMSMAEQARQSYPMGNGYLPTPDDLPGFACSQ